MITSQPMSLETTATHFCRIETIIDTRQYDIQTCKPIPGTGDPIPCDCCGRETLVHAHVQEIDRMTRKTTRRGIVGTQCCKKAKMTHYGNSPSNRDYWKRSY